MLSDKMKEISKENLLKIIQEEGSQITEMADEITIGHLHGTRKRRGEGPKAEKLGSKFPLRKAFPAPGDDKEFPSVHVLNPNQEPEQQHVWVFIDRESADHLLENKEWATWFEESILKIELGVPKDKVTGEPIADYNWKIDKERIFYGTPQDIDMASKTGGIPAYFRIKRDRQRDLYYDKTGILWPDLVTGEKATPRELFLRRLYRIMRGYFESSQLTKHLNLSGLPLIQIQDSKKGSQKKGTDTYSTKENDNFTYRSTWYLPYENYLEFAKHSEELLDLIGGSPEEYDDYEHKKGMNHARKFNLRRKQWSYNRAQQKMPESFKEIALTPIHKNERGGYKATDQDYMVCNWFTMTGRLVDEGDGQKYVWTIDFKIEIGEKLVEASYSPLKPYLDFPNVMVETPVIPGGIKWDPKETILSNTKVEGSLKRACQEMVNNILKYNPKDDLIYRTQRLKSDITKLSSLSESKINTIVNDVLKQLKK